MSFTKEWNEMAADVHAIFQNKGFWDVDDRNDGEMIALIHSELSKALEALRIGNPSSEKISRFSQVEEEFADVVIRLMDMAYARGWDVGHALIAKMMYNQTRPPKHGNKKF